MPRRRWSHARSIKTEREIELLRRASHLADVAHETLAELARTAGQTEFAMFCEISARVFAAAGRDIPLSGELVTGPRTTTVEYPNGPRARTTEPGDAALMDLSGRSEGYWFDCTNTHVIGAEPTADTTTLWAGVAGCLRSGDGGAETRCESVGRGECGGSGVRVTRVADGALRRSPDRRDGQ